MISPINNPFNSSYPSHLGASSSSSSDSTSNSKSNYIGNEGYVHINDKALELVYIKDDGTIISITRQWKDLSEDIRSDIKDLFSEAFKHFKKDMNFDQSIFDNTSGELKNKHSQTVGTSLSTASVSLLNKIIQNLGTNAKDIKYGESSKSRSSIKKPSGSTGNFGFFLPEKPDEISARGLVHIMGSRNIIESLGRKDLESAGFESSLKYMIQNLEHLKERSDLTTKDQQEITKSLDKLKSMHSTYSQFNDLDKSRNNPGKRLGLTKKIIRDINIQLSALKPNESILIPGGCVTTDGTGHQMLYEITKKSNDTFTMRVYNSGAGVEEYHPLHPEDLSKIHRANYIEVSGIPLDKFQEDNSNFYRLIAMQGGGEGSTFDPSIIYKELLPAMGKVSPKKKEASWFQKLRGKPEGNFSREAMQVYKEAEGLPKKHFSPPQEAGFCVWESMLRYIKSNTSLETFQRIKLLTQVKAIEKFAHNSLDASSKKTALLSESIKTLRGRVTEADTSVLSAPQRKSILDRLSKISTLSSILTEPVH